MNPRHKFEGAAPVGGTDGLLIGEPLTVSLARDVLSRPDLPREVLVSALHESVRQFESMLSCVSGTFYRCELAPPWRMEFISNGIEEITGYEPQFFATTPYGAIMEPEDVAAMEPIVAGAVERREHFSVNYRIQHKSGEIRWVSERGVAVYDTTGKPQFLEGYMKDVTATKELEFQAEQARLKAESLNGQLSDILENTLDCVMSFDRDWNTTFANGRALNEISSYGHDRPNNLRDFAPARTAPFWDVFEHTMINREARRIEAFMEPLGVWFDLYAVPDGDGMTVFFRNISEEKRLQQELVNQAKMLAERLDSIPVMVWAAEPDGTAEYYNRCWKEFVGSNPKEESSTPPVDWLHPDDRDFARRSWRNALKEGAPFEMEVRLRHHSGEYRWVLGRNWPQRNERGEIIKWFNAATDIHERVLADRRLKKSLKLQESFFDSSLDFITVMDLEGRIVLTNNSISREKVVPDPQALVGRLSADLWPQKSRRNIRKAIAEAGKGKPVRFTCSHTKPGEGQRWWDIMLTPVTDDHGTITNLLCVSRDVTQLRAATERLRIVSEQDFLTSLPNRRAFERHLRNMTVRAREHDTKIGLMLLDLDHFKHVNDTLGHLAGDKLLRTLAKRLQACVADNGFVARLGGDEFAVVLDNIVDAMDLITAATGILSRMEQPVIYQGKLINGGLSIGCAIYPQDATDAQGLLKHADTALYDLKASGRGGIQMFDSHMKEAAERTATQLSVARQVIHEDAVEPYYQPKVRLDTGAVAGFEALLRWWSPASGIQMPGTVAEAFNDYELSTKIGGRIQQRVLADLSAWLKLGLDVLPVSINASPAEFLRDDYAERLLQRILSSGVSPSLIEVEITEHVFLESRSAQVIRALGLLKKAGVKIALDDFGTGYSSLSHLHDFPVDVIKIDRSFVSGMLIESSMFAIVQAIAKLGPSLGVEIVAEGIETAEQLHALRQAGCALGQGYFFGKAMDAFEIADRLASGNWDYTERAAPFRRSVLSASQFR